AKKHQALVQFRSSPVVETSRDETREENEIAKSDGHEGQRIGKAATGVPAVPRTPLSASAAGPLAYRTGSPGGKRQLVWFDRSGTEVLKIGKPESFGPSYISIS